MRDQPDILVLDGDGLLSDVVEFLREMEADFVEWNGAPGSYAGSRPRLIVATMKHALAFGEAESGSEKSEGSVRIAIVEGSTRTLEGRLRELGFDFLVRRPVHPLALQLLLQRFVDQGDEKRVTQRVPIGWMVSYRSGLRKRRALLVDLSLRGCRLLVDRASEPDTSLTISLPEDLGAGASLSLPGRVRRCEAADPSGELGFSLGVVFGELSARSERALGRVLDDWAQGLHALPPQQAATTPDRSRLRWRPRLRPKRGHRRHAARRRFRRRVSALGRRGAAMRTLVGRNLSTGGMLVEPHPDLALGDALCLALCGGSGERIVVRAEVVRDDGEDGLGLRFLECSEEVRQQLEATLDALPAVERFVEGEMRGIATVVGEMQMAR